MIEVFVESRFADGTPKNLLARFLMTRSKIGKWYIIKKSFLIHFKHADSESGY